MCRFLWRHAPGHCSPMYFAVHALCQYCLSQHCSSLLGYAGPNYHHIGGASCQAGNMWWQTSCRPCIFGVGKWLPVIRRRHPVTISQKRSRWNTGTASFAVHQSAIAPHCRSSCYHPAGFIWSITPAVSADNPRHARTRIACQPQSSLLPTSIKHAIRSHPKK